MINLVSLTFTHSETTMNQAHIPVICITGGPCAGKTTVLSFLQQQLANIGFTVITINEAATEFILSGLNPRLIDAFHFQRQLFRYTIEKEDRWKEAAVLMQAEKKVIICDRGVVDAAAYSSAEEFDLILNELGCSIVELRDQRYDAVVFLRSVAVDAPEVYTCINNTARRESIDEARALDARTLGVWNGHPHLRIIDNRTDIEGKSHRVFQTICQILGIP